VSTEKLTARAALGARAEQLTCDYLVGRGFEIVGRNVRVGRLELDLIARRGTLLVVCEVRSRRSDRVMTPAQSVDYRKVAHVRTATLRWLRETRPGTSQLRFDVASVLFDTPAGRLNYMEGAF